MNNTIKSIRPFIGAKNFDISRKFYANVGFTEHVISPQLSYFESQKIGFYLQDAYVKNWVDNTMEFVEVDNVDDYWKSLVSLRLEAKYENVRLIPIRHLEWGKEFFMHDPSGILWHFGAFK
jgi:hypothetical protein